MIGETLSHFQVVDKLGQGGMGVVYRGVDLNLDRPVAIKVLPPEAQRDEDSVGRFLREAKTASKLQHPAITTIYEFGVKDDLRYLVMEYIEGKTLKEMLKKGPLPIRQALEIAVPVADALTLAEEIGIIHRDIKSENIMVTERGQVKILDFGLAKMMAKSGPAAQDTFHTAVGLVMGTVTHMSPEQVLGTELDARTDIYSTGVVLFEMVTGRLPFTGDSPNAILNLVLNKPPPSPSTYNPDVPPALEQLIVKCLEKNREKRYQSPTQLLLELRGLKQKIESQRDWSGTMIAAPVKDQPVAAAPTVKLTEPGLQLARQAPAARASSEAVTQPTPAPPAAVRAASPRGVSAAPSGSSPPPAAAPAASSVAAPPSAPEAAPPRAPLPHPPRAAAPRPSGKWRVYVCFGLGALRRIVFLAALLYALGCVALFALPFVQPKAAANLPAVRLLHQAIDPALAFVAGFLKFNFTYQKLNFLPLGLALAVYFLQQAVTGSLGRLEARLRRKPMIKKPIIYTHPAATAGEGSRMSLLRDYAASKRILGEAKKELAFLAIDVVGSTKMKANEDKIAIEHAFSEYKKFLERIFREFHAYKVAWTPDGVMSCFFSVDEAAGASRKLLVELDWFNRDVHQLRSKFRVRCGLNYGEVLLPDNKPLEEVSDEVIDVAGHMQKYAQVDTLWSSGEAYNRLLDRSGFTRMDTQVDNNDVFAWRRPS